MSPFPTYREVGTLVVQQVISNYLYSDYTTANQAAMYADVVAALHVLWKDIEFYVQPTFNSYGIIFAIRVDIDKDDPIFVDVEYNWG